MTYTIKKLGEVVEFKYGKGIPQDQRNECGKVPIYGANGILGWTDKEWASGEAIIIGRKGSAGELTRVSGKFWPSDVTYYALGSSHIDIDYLFHFLKGVNLPKLATGIKPGINRNRLYEIGIPVPPVGEQKKIVEKLEKQFTKIDEAAHLRAESENLVGHLRTSALHEIFSSVASKGWNVKTIEEATELVTKGTTPKTYGHAFTVSGIPFLKAENINGIVYAESTRTYISKETHNFLARSKTKPGDVLMTIAGTIGRIGWIPVGEQEMNMNQAVAIIRPKQDLITTEYLAYVLSSTSSKEQVGRGTVKMAIPNFSLGMIKKIKIPIPPLAEQKKIVKKLDALSETARDLHDLHSSQSADLKSLKQSILHDAFLGSR